MKSSIQIVDPSGKPVQSQKYAPCPQCGASPEKRVPSSGFGTPHLICMCGYEFKELLCPSIT